MGRQSASYKSFGKWREHSFFFETPAPYVEGGHLACNLDSYSVPFLFDDFRESVGLMVGIVEIPTFNPLRSLEKSVTLWTIAPRQLPARISY